MAALLDVPVREPPHCRCCGRPVPVGPLVQGLGSKCARKAGLCPPRRIRAPAVSGQPGPDLLDLIEGARSVDELSRCVLDTPMDANDASAATVRDYLIELLATLWVEEGDFSGKHPLGNDGWQYEVYEPLVKAGLIEGTLLEDGDVELDTAVADKVIVAAIRSLGASA